MELYSPESAGEEEKKSNYEKYFLKNTIGPFKKTFRIKCTKNLSFIEKAILRSIKRKSIYYAIDDISYILRSTPIELEDLLLMLYSPIISLQNDFSVSFFNISVIDIYITEITKDNKFLSLNHTQKNSYVIITLLYRLSVPTEKQETLW